ncbi:MAG: DUF1501 domain-containing protein [Bdellovibrionaceae bacterium]|nr:DUF1501 domain-containing protein [Pseudobdellovibrionaceae bacterium]
MKKQFLNLQTSFDTLRDKYANLMRRSCSTESALILSGVDDVNVPGRSIKGYDVDDSDFFSGSNLNDIVTANSKIDGLAESLAIAEFMLKENLSSAFSFKVGGLSDTRVTQTANKSSGSLSGEHRIDFGLDSHFLGSHPALVVHSRYYRALSAGLFEFIQQLKSVPTSKGNLFNQTAIVVNSEFGRQPRLSAVGADHGPGSASYTIFSGMVKDLTVLGNIKSTDSDAYGGTSGQAAGLKELGGRTAILGNCLSTVSAMVEVKTPMPNDQSFVAKKNDQIVPLITSCKNYRKNESGGTA